MVPGQPAEPLAGLTEEPQSDVAPAPRGNRIAYLCGADLCVAALDGAKVVASKVYTTGRPEVSVEEFHWSGDGRSIAFIETDLSRVPTRGLPDYLANETRLDPIKRAFPGEPSESRRLGIVAADGGTVRWADIGADPLDLIFGVSWSPDSQSLLVDKSDLYIKDRRLLLVKAHDGSSTLLLRETDPGNVTAEWWSDWAPDGRGVYLISGSRQRLSRLLPVTERERANAGHAWRLRRVLGERVPRLPSSFLSLPTRVGPRNGTSLRYPSAAAQAQLLRAPRAHITQWRPQTVATSPIFTPTTSRHRICT